MSRNLLARIAVAAVAIPAILWICYEGGWWLFGMVALFALVAISEFMVAEGLRPAQLSFWLGLLAVGGIFVVLGMSAIADGTVALVPVGLILLAFFLITGMLTALGREEPAKLFARFTRLLFGVLYVGMLYPFVYLVGTSFKLPYRDAFSGGDLLLLLFAVLWVGDTAAMWVGKGLGSHKLAPTVSPNKTVEGFLGGLLGAAIVGLVMMAWKFHNIPSYHIVIVAIGCSVFGQLGDLVESMWKRSLGIKDSSSLIPGHGGILDRFDSLLFAAPFMYFYVAHFFM